MAARRVLVYVTPATSPGGCKRFSPRHGGARRSLADTKTAPTSRTTKLDKIENFHSTDSIDTETSGTRGLSIWVHSSQVGLLDSSVHHNRLPELGGAVGNGRRARPSEHTEAG